jgi:hypothetical protein
MNRHPKDRSALVRGVAVAATVGAACLTRPVTTAPPTSTEIFTIALHNEQINKIDLLFMIDNSASMGDKQKLLAHAVPDMITRLVQPACVDTHGNRLGMNSDMNGRCAAGKPEFPAVHDMHIGIVTSSLGGRGGTSTCSPDEMNSASTLGLNAHNDDRGRLINRGGQAETTIPNTLGANGAQLNFLAWYPMVAANKSANNPPPPVPAETTIGDPQTPGTLIGDFTAMIEGVHEHGCGFEAQNEAWYRFLVQPDPFDQIQINGTRASLTGLDSVILQQRAAFLRPDSLLAVIVVTDENEEVSNPLSISGQGWLYQTSPFLGSPTYGAPEGTVECQSTPGPMSGPNDPNCTSCALSSVQSASNFSSRCPDNPPGGVQGFLSAKNDSVNVRFFHQKQRFGVFAGYPIERYTRGLTKPSVPDRDHEVDGNGNYVGDQDKYANCVNPIFAQNLPTDPKADRCHLTRGPRTPDQVYYAAIGGVPHELLQAQSGDTECTAGTPQADCPQKGQLTDSDWLAITGQDPEHYDFSGADFHMLESEDPRGGSNCLPNGTDGCDPINGREWNTALGGSKQDLQFACIFQLTDPQTGAPAPKDCTLMQYHDACDCEPSQGVANPFAKPLCQKDTNGQYTPIQAFGKAYPSVREMVIAHTMGKQGIVSSLCPIHVSYKNGDLTDPLYGYRPAANAVVNRLKDSLTVQCLPQRLSQNASDLTVPCLILVTLPKQGDESACSKIPGLSAPDPIVLAAFKAAQEAAWDPGSGAIEPKLLPTCALKQLTNTQATDAQDFGPDGTCSGSTHSGWCYVEGAEGCPQQILFTPAGTVVTSGATVNLQCFEHAAVAVDGDSGTLVR